MARADHYYRGVRGSAALSTRPVDPGAVAAEALEPGEMRRVPFQGALLGAARVRASFAAIPLDAFDRACEALEAEEQAAYLHLLRLSYGEGRNWCRAGKKELMARLRLSERRLLRVLDALVSRRFARPLHRDNRGTLWHVALPREAFGEALGDEVLLGRAAPALLPERAPDEPAPRQPPPRRASATVATLRQAERGEAALARALGEARGATDPEGLARASREVRELLAEGQRPERIAAAIEAIRRRAARAGQRGPP
jgi:hypothetical protein